MAESPGAPPASRPSGDARPGPGASGGRGRVVAVVGATGLLGRALVAAFSNRPGWTVYPLGHDRIEIVDRESIARALDPVPDVVVNATLPDWSRQEDADLFLRVNALGPRLLAERCAGAGSILVQVSTDFVFDGEGGAPYREADRPEPRSVYGISKLAGEQLVRTALPGRHLIVRVAYLFGPGGSRAKRGANIVSTLLDLGREGGPVRLVTDQRFSPTYAPDAAATVRRLLEAGVAGTVHVTNQGECSPFELGRYVYEVVGLGPDVVPVRLADLPPGPYRPRYTVLAHEALRRAGIEPPRPWPAAVREYLLHLLQPADERGGRDEDRVGSEPGRAR